MFEHMGVWFPDGESEIRQQLAAAPVVDGKGTYQYHKLQAAMKRVSRRRTALDIGGHVGLWSMQLAKLFRQVVAFEPVPQFRECFARNVPNANVTLHPVALGAPGSPPEVMMHVKLEHSGGTRVDPTRTAPRGVLAPLRQLDSFNLQEVDFIKIDVEGFEKFVFEGGAETLRRCKPVLIVEAKPLNAQRFGLREQEALEFLLAAGFCIIGEISRDFILQPVEET